MEKYYSFQFKILQFWLVSVSGLNQKGGTLLPSKNIKAKQNSLSKTNIFFSCFEGRSKDREAFRTLDKSLVQMTTFISQIFLKLFELQFKVPILPE